MCVYVIVWIGKAPHTIVVGIVLTYKHMRIPFHTRKCLDSKNIIDFNHIWDLAHLLYSILELCMFNYKKSNYAFRFICRWYNILHKSSMHIVVHQIFQLIWYLIDRHQELKKFYASKKCKYYDDVESIFAIPLKTNSPREIF